MKPVVFSGSFDPVTNGHLDLIKRARAVFGAVRIVVCSNVAKRYLFTPQERVRLVQEALQGEANITVDLCEGLLTDYLKANRLTVIVRGLRHAHDWNHERTNAHYNKLFAPEVETVFLPARTAFQYISSGAVKEALFYGADVSTLVPPCVLKALEQK